MRILKVVTAALVGSAILGASAANAATVVYSNDFESGNTSNLSGGDIAGTQGFSNNGYGGSFYHNTTVNDATTLTLNDLAPHSEVTVTFDLALIDSWDGSHSIWGTDLFNISADGAVLFSALAGNSVSISRLGTMRSELGNIFGNRFGDASYRISLTFAHSASDLILSMFGSTGNGTGVGFQGGLDENFAIDNIVISTNADAIATPLPAAAWFMGAGIAGYAASRRKKA